MSLSYTAMPLDRCTHQRKDKRWLKRQFDSPNARFVVVDQGCHLLKESAAGLEPVLLHAAEIDHLSVESTILLGVEQACPIFALDSEKLSPAKRNQLSNLGQWMDLRHSGPQLAAQIASILALAKALVHWHRSHQFCGCCGQRNIAVEAGHARRCEDIKCHQMTFPRTDPAVIMLVEKQFDDGIARCLLGRQSSWVAGMYSTLAGFVDPGESLEQAVIREVYEESCIEVAQVQYVASQPWPFPGSIMLGFIAQASSSTIDISADDLEDARWFSRQELKKFGEFHDQDHAFKLSRQDSISYYLTTAWCNGEIGKFKD